MTITTHIVNTGHHGLQMIPIMDTTPETITGESLWQELHAEIRECKCANCRWVKNLMFRTLWN